jgi:electron transport complex protein RnfB
MMTGRDAHEALLDLYRQSPMMDESFAGSLMALLRLQFTESEAELAVKVGFEGSTLERILESVDMDRDELARMLDLMARKGTMWVSPFSEDPVYRTIGIAGPGLIETGAWGGVRFASSVAVMKAMWTFQQDFARNMLARFPVPVARVWAARATLPEDARPEEDVAGLIGRAGFWGVSECSCRLPHWISDPGDHCQHMLETCLFMGDHARWGVRYGLCREISYEEAVELLGMCHRDGLVHTYDPDQFICSCCPDCCVLQIGHAQPGARVLEPSPFVAGIDAIECEGCGSCADRCPFGAITVDEHGSVDADTCLGCGVCVPACETGALGLARRPA